MKTTKKKKGGKKGAGKDGPVVFKPFKEEESGSSAETTPSYLGVSK